MKMKRNFLQIFTLCFCLVFVATGCGNNNSTENNTGTQKPLNSTTQTGTNNTQNGTNTGVSSADSERRVLADRICRSIEGIDGVQDATVLIADASSTNNQNSSGNTASNTNPNNSTAAPSKTSNETKTSGTGTTSGTSGAINNTNGGSNTGTNNNNDNAVSSTSSNSTSGNSNASYIAIVGVTTTEGTQTNSEKQNSLAQNIRQMILQQENNIEDVVVTMDENDIQKIGNLANNTMQNTSQDATSEINRLRDDLMNAGTNLTRSAKDVTNGVANGVKDLVR